MACSKLVHQDPVHFTCVWLILWLGAQTTGDDVGESGQGTMGITSHCCIGSCDWRWKITTPNCRNECHILAHLLWLVHNNCDWSLGWEREDTLQLVSLPLICIFVIFFFTLYLTLPYGNLVVNSPRAWGFCSLQAHVSDPFSPCVWCGTTWAFHDELCSYFMRKLLMLI